MDLLEKTKKICELFDIHPARSKGQNFLISEDVYDKIVAAADISSTDTVLEVGPGLGFLTAKLAQKAGQVIAVELDDKLAAYLRDAITSGNIDNVEIANKNILDVQIPELFSKPKVDNLKFKIVANLPYNITSVFLRKFLSENKIKPDLMVLLLQKEVAERICARPGDMSLLALSVQFYAEPEIIGYVSRENFWPAPKVDSAIIKLRITNYELQININEKKFWRLAKFGFSAKRKMLKNNLAAGLKISTAEAEAALAKAGLDPKVRAEDLSLADWLEMLKIIK